jgi:hypothetical protein
MPRSIVIVHGWSDESKSFKRLADQVQAWFKTPPIVIQLADWISLQDDVTYPDLALAMERAWSANELPREPRAVDVIVHSTGALVVRDWMTRHFTPQTVPIMRLLMLAPANFGSPLAHKGRSFIGRVLKGWNRFFGQTGTRILKGLELGSPYTVELAERDLFVDGQAWYGAQRILATVLVGNTGYDGVEAIANEDGGDGTVRISTANLNAARLTFALDERQQLKPGWSLQVSKGEIAFGIVAGENHSTVALKDRGPKNAATLILIQAALSVTDQDYTLAGDTFPWQQRIDQSDPLILSRSPRYQNLVTHVQDDFGQQVQDYFIQLYRKVNADRHFEKQLYEKVISSVHAYEDNAAYRSIYFSIQALDDILGGFDVETLYLSLTAQPLFNPPRQPVGYASVGAGDTDGIGIPAADIGKFFAAHRTLIVKATLQRLVDRSVFALKSS